MRTVDGGVGGEVMNDWGEKNQEQAVCPLFEGSSAFDDESACDASQLKSESESDEEMQDISESIDRRETAHVCESKPEVGRERHGYGEGGAVLYGSQPSSPV